MYVYSQGHSRLISTGVYLPATRVTTRALMAEIDSENRFGVSHAWLEKVTGIREKRVTPANVLPSDMAAAAAREAMRRGNIAAEDIDAIIYCGLVRDYLEPATAHIVQAKLAATNAMVFDVSNACHGFMNGIHVMDALIATGQVRHGLIVTGEQGSIFTRRAVTALNQTEKKDDLLMLAAGLTLGDAGAAVVMGPKRAADGGFMGFMLHSQGQYASYCTSGGPAEEGVLLTDMPAIVEATTKMLVPMFQDFLFRRLRWQVGDLAKYIMHQVGRRTFKLHAHFGGIPTQIMPDTVTTFGNLVTATIPLNLHMVSTNNEVAAGDKIFLSGAGSGISISQAGLVWDAAA
jgi:3-oxoacyl-[acyl-carrier-protein] synthase-3